MNIEYDSFHFYVLQETCIQFQCVTYYKCYIYYSPSQPCLVPYVFIMKDLKDEN